MAKVIKSFTMLEKEFNVDASAVAASVPAGKLDEYLMRLQPPVSFQDENNKLNAAKIDAGSFNENLLDRFSGVDQNDYENVLVQSKTTQRIYENVEVKRKLVDANITKNKTPPTPLPRQQAIQADINMVNTTNSLPRSKQIKDNVPVIDEIHNCKVTEHEEGAINDKKDFDDVPRLINFLPKIADVVTEQQPAIRKCTPVIVADNEDNYVTSSSDEDEEKSYEPNASVDRRDSSDTLSDEDGEKLGPPDIINGPGSSEAYFNFHWSASMLPTIGEVEEELSSLEPQPFG